MWNASGVKKVHLAVCPKCGRISVDDRREFDAWDEAESGTLRVEGCRE